MIVHITYNKIKNVPKIIKSSKKSLKLLDHYN